MFVPYFIANLLVWDQHQGHFIKKSIGPVSLFFTIEVPPTIVQLCHSEAKAFFDGVQVDVSPHLQFRWANILIASRARTPKLAELIYNFSQHKTFRM